MVVDGAEDLGRAEAPARRRIVEPVGMLTRQPRAVARVVDHHVEDQAHPRRVHGGAQARQISSRAELGLERVVGRVDVVDPVAVIAARVAGRTGLAIRRRDPDGGRTKVLHVAEALAKPREVTAVEAARVGAVEAAGGVVVGRVAVAKTIGDDEIEHLRAPAGARGGRGLDAIDGVVVSDGVAAAGERAQEGEPLVAHERTMRAAALARRRRAVNFRGVAVVIAWAGAPAAHRAQAAAPPPAPPVALATAAARTGRETPPRTPTDCRNRRAPPLRSLRSD